MVLEPKKRCPICKSEVKGSAEILYFCKRCNLFFTEKNLYKLFKKE